MVKVLLLVMGLFFTGIVFSDYQVKVLPSYEFPKDPPAGMKAPTTAEEKFYKEHGYYYDNKSPTAQQLLAKAYDGKDKNSNAAKKPVDPANLNMAFNFFGLPMIPAENVIKYETSPMKNNEGKYLVVTEYFSSKQLGVCEMTWQSVKDNNGSIEYNADNVEYDVNGKPGNKFAQGSPKTGYTYGLEWSDSRFFYSLSCTSKNYDGNRQSTQIQLARTIDRFYESVK